jgi:hypothetical protein
MACCGPASFTTSRSSGIRIDPLNLRHDTFHGNGLKWSDPERRHTVRLRQVIDPRS